MRLPAWARPPDRWGTPVTSPTSCVAVPGLGLSVLGWAPTLARSARPAGALVVAVPGFGVPAGWRQDLGPRASARRLITLLDELGVERTVLLGHSASCPVVAEVARAVPERVAALVLVGPTGDPGGGTWARLVGRWLRTVVREPLWQAPLLARDYTYSGLISFARALDATRTHPLDEVLAVLRCPILLVRGAHDRICPPTWIDCLAGRSVDATTCTVPTAAHMAPLTRPRELAAILGPFLESVQPSGTAGR